MDTYKLFETILILGCVLAVMVALLYGYKRFMHLFPRTPYIFGTSPVQIEFRYPLDTRRQILRVKDDKHHYTLLLGETNLLLDKTPLVITDQKEDINV